MTGRVDPQVIVDRREHIVRRLGIVLGKGTFCVRRTNHAATFHFATGKCR